MRSAAFVPAVDRARMAAHPIDAHTELHVPLP